MSKTIQHKIAFNSKSLNVLLISCFFILVSFFLHNQHSFFNLNKSIGKKNIEFFTNVKNAKYPAQFHFATNPSVESVITIDQLEDSEDDNEQKGSKVNCADILQKFSKNEHNYSSILRCRYLQFALSIQKRSDIPYFILHHSWKTHIS
jgi:hypothetical protein